jgi:HK97 family phage portal protein
MLRQIGSFLLYGGKNHYTQTRYQSFYQPFTMKGEQWVSDENPFHLYSTTPHLAAVINRKASMVSTGRWKHYRNGEEVENSDVVRMLENPNPLLNGNEFVRGCSISFSIYGNTVIYANRVFNNPIPKQMQLLPYGKINIKRTGRIYKQTDLDEIITSVKVDTEPFEIKDLIWMRNMNIDDPVLGLSPMAGLLMPISNIRGAYGFRNRIITNNAMLGILSSGGGNGMDAVNGLDEKERQRIDQAMQSSFGMQDGKMNILQTDANVVWQAMGYPTKDLMLFEEIDQDFRIIIDSYGLNDNIFSREKASTFSNLKEGVIMAYNDGVIPFAEALSMELSKSFGMDGKTEWLSLDYSHISILREDEKTKSENNKRNAEAAAILTANGYTTEAAALVATINA